MLLCNVFLLLIVCAAATAKNDKLQKHAGGEPGSYIVVYKDMGNETARDKAKGDKFKGKKAKGLDNLDMVTVENITESEAEELSQDPAVDYVEQSQYVYATQACEPRQYDDVVWGLDRSDEVPRTLDGTYIPNIVNPSGEDVVVYITDTGIYPAHPDFQGRASDGGSFISEPDGDRNGHGTHCAGTVGSYTYGINKRAKIVGIKVLSGSGSGSTTGVVNGMDLAISLHNARGGKGVAKSVVSMSLGGGGSSTLDSAVRRIYNAGIPCVVAAGNENGVATGSPAREPLAITVGATDSSDNKASFSSYGSVLDIQAPGVSIRSTWIESSGRKRRDVMKQQLRERRAPKQCRGTGKWRCTSPTTTTTTTTTTTSGVTSPTRLTSGVTSPTRATSGTTTTDLPPPTTTGPTRTISGTSMSTPHVAGVCSLILMNAPPGVVLTPDQVIAEIQRISAKGAAKGFNGQTTPDLLQAPTCA